MKYLFCNFELFERTVTIYIVDEEQGTHTILCQVINWPDSIASVLTAQCLQLEINTVKLAGPNSFVKGIIELLPPSISATYLA